jgi:Family of unknown function (DUF5946)
MNKEIRTTIRCFGCGAVVPDIAGPTHPYMASSPGCWKLYGDILAKEYAPGNYDPDIHGISVDAYAVQHVGEPESRTIRSVNLHLIRLYSAFERGLSGQAAIKIIRLAAENGNLARRFQWLEPPSFENTLKVTDVLAAHDFEEHKRLVRAWGESAWQAWKEMHLSMVETFSKEVGL